MSAFEYIDVCKILRRKETDIYGGTGADEYDTYSESERCLFSYKQGNTMKQDSQGRDIISDCILRIDAEILITDLIVFEDYKYQPILVMPMKNRITNNVEYYRVYLQKMTITPYTDEAEQNEPIIK